MDCDNLEEDVTDDMLVGDSPSVPVHDETNLAEDDMIQTTDEYVPPPVGDQFAEQAAEQISEEQPEEICDPQDQQQKERECAYKTVQTRFLAYRSSGICWIDDRGHILAQAGIEGLDTIEDLITRWVVLPALQPIAYARIIESISTSVGIVGREGIGKRTAVLALCKAYGITMLCMRIYFKGDIRSCLWYGASHKPCVLYFDDIANLFKQPGFLEEFTYEIRTTKILNVWFVFSAETIAPFVPSATRMYIQEVSNTQSELASKTCASNKPGVTGVATVLDALQSIAPPNDSSVVDTSVYDMVGERVIFIPEFHRDTIAMLIKNEFLPKRCHVKMQPPIDSTQFLTLSLACQGVTPADGYYFAFKVFMNACNHMPQLDLFRLFGNVRMQQCRAEESHARGSTSNPSIYAEITAKWEDDLFPLIQTVTPSGKAMGDESTSICADKFRYYRRFSSSLQNASAQTAAQVDVSQPGVQRINALIEGIRRGKQTPATLRSPGCDTHT